METITRLQDDTRQMKVARLTANLAQAAGTYTLGTVSVGAIQISKATVYVSTAGATFTSVQIKTNQTNSVNIMSAAEGAVANLTAQKNVTIANANVPITLESGQLLQYVIVGATGTGQLLVTIEYRPITAGATLA